MTLCVVCPAFRPASKPRMPDFPLVCTGCRTQVRIELSEIPDLYARLDSARAGSGAGPKVSGSREAPVPVSLDAVDLSAPARAGSVGVRHRGDWSTKGGDPDQVGYLPVATELDTWVRDWISHDWCPGDHLPAPTVAILAGWLRVRLDDACDRHPAIDEFAATVKSVRRALTRSIGELRHVDRLPAPCPTCDLTTLIRRDGAAYVECTSCGRLWTEEDYRRLCVVLAAEQEVA